MSKNLLFFIVILCTQLSSGQNSLQQPQPFLEEIISGFPSVRDLSISAAEDEVYFTVQTYLGEISAIFSSRFNGDSWSKPELASFSGRYQDMEAFLAPDQLHLYFVSNRPLDNKSVDGKDFDIYVVERNDPKSKWSEPKNIGLPVNTPEDEFYPTLSTSGTICFTRDGTGSKGKDDIFMSHLIHGQYEKPTSMDTSVNSEGLEFNAFLAPDESYLLYTCYKRADGQGSGDLYISRKNEKGEWSMAEVLGPEINSAQMDYCPFVNSKTGILYFTSRRSNIPKNLDNYKNTEQMMKEIGRYENGQSRLYRVDANSILKK